MIDSLNCRLADITTTEAVKDVTTKKKISIDISSVLPLVSIINTHIAGQLIKELVTPKVVDLATVINGITDLAYLALNGQERFVFITQSVSAVSGTSVRLYYDAKYKDIIVIPNLDMIASNTVDDIVTNAVFELSGYVVGGGLINAGKSILTARIPVLEKTMLDLPMPGTTTEVANDLVQIVLGSEIADSYPVGTTVDGTTSLAIGTVFIVETINATTVITLENVTGTFQVGETISNGTTTTTETIASIDTELTDTVLDSGFETTNRFYRLPGLADNTRNGRAMERMITNDVNYIDAQIVPTASIDLGDGAAFFGTDNVIPQYTMYEDGIGTYAIKYAGPRKPESGKNLHIFLNF